MEGKEDVEEIRLIKLLLVHDTKLEQLHGKVDEIKSFLLTQVADKEAWIRKLIYLIIALLGALAGAGGLVKAILGVP